MLVYWAMAVELPPWALKTIDKIRRNFLWRGRKDAKSGHCLLAWPKVCRPVEIIGLGISNLQNLNWALRMRWIWLQKTEANWPWSAFTIQVHGCVWAFFFHGSSVRNWTPLLYFGLIHGYTDNVLLILHPGCFHLCRKGELIRGLCKKPLRITVGYLTSKVL